MTSSSRGQVTTVKREERVVITGKLELTDAEARALHRELGEVLGIEPEVREVPIKVAYSDWCDEIHKYEADRAYGGGGGISGSGVAFARLRLFNRMQGRGWVKG